jgi:hypothetical protein
MYRKIIIFFAILALTTLACGFNVPQAPQPGPDMTDEINVPYPDSDEINLKLSFGAGELTLNPGADVLVMEPPLITTMNSSQTSLPTAAMSKSALGMKTSISCRISMTSKTNGI